MRRPLSLTENGSTTLASGALYNASSQLAQYAYEGWIETRQYKVLGQLTRITVPGVFDMEYRFSATQNNGRVTQQKDWITGEEVSYTCDSLQRLVTAATTSTAWGLAFAYDGFGNKTAQSLTKGTGPTHTLAVDGNTNRIVGATYDANGNQYPTSGEVFDVDNRMTYTPGAQYACDSQNRRVYKLSGAFEMTFYGIEGRRLATYQVNLTFPNVVHFTETSRNIYFGGRLIRNGGASVILDRLGSVRYRKQGTTTERLDYWPYGEEKPSATAQDREKFATYYRDQTGLDYADQRYYISQWGRFVTADPYQASAGPTEPQSWNRYAYVVGDPVNKNDPSGPFAAWACMDCLMAPPDADGGGGGGGVVWVPDLGPNALASLNAWAEAAEADYVQTVQSAFLANALNNFQQQGVLTQEGEDFLANHVFPAGEVVGAALVYDDGCPPAGCPEDGDGAGDVPLNRNAILILGQVGQTTAPLTEPGFWAGWTAAATAVALAPQLSIYQYPRAGGVGLVFARGVARLDFHQIPFVNRIPTELLHIDIQGVTKHWPWTRRVIETIERMGGWEP